MEEELLSLDLENMSRFLKRYKDSDKYDFDPSRLIDTAMEIKVTSRHLEQLEKVVLPKNCIAILTLIDLILGLQR